MVVRDSVGADHTFPFATKSFCSCGIRLILVSIKLPASKSARAPLGTQVAKKICLNRVRADDFPGFPLRKKKKMRLEVSNARW